MQNWSPGSGWHAVPRGTALVDRAGALWVTKVGPVTARLFPDAEGQQAVAGGDRGIQAILHPEKPRQFISLGSIAHRISVSS